MIDILSNDNRHDRASEASELPLLRLAVSPGSEAAGGGAGGEASGPGPGLAAPSPNRARLPVAPPEAPPHSGRPSAGRPSSMTSGSPRSSCRGG